jgi:CTP:molybdopterin cytidylyltransferase MocA
VPERNVAGVLLAAGDGSRLGQPKALVVLGGQSLARRGIGVLRAGGADPVIVVTGAAGPGRLDAPTADAGTAEQTRPGGRDRAVAGAPAAADPSGADPVAADLITVHNPDWRAGMGSSLRAGLAAVPASCGAAVLALADQPLVGPAAVARLLGAYAAGASIAVACYEGKPRNPVLISREHWPEVVALATGDVGARPFLRAHQSDITRVECGDTGSPDDIDTPDDLERISRLAESASFLT